MGERLQSIDLDAFTTHCSRSRRQDLKPAADRPAQYGQVMEARSAKFRIGQVVKHRIYPFRGVIFDVDPVFSNTE